MDAQRFTTFSAGPGAYEFARQWHHLHTHPWEVYAAMKSDDWERMPRHERSPTQPDQPIYQVNVNYEMHCAIAFANCFRGVPDFWRCHTDKDDGAYKYSLIHSMHPTDSFIEYAKKDWDRYQDLIHDRNPGFKDAPRVEYPYTKEMVEKWFAKYSEELQIPISAEGPTKEYKDNGLATYIANDSVTKAKSIPHLIRQTKYLPNLKDDEDALAEALASSLYSLKKDLTASKSDSGMDFDDKQYDAWKDCMATDYNFTCEEIDELSKNVLGDNAAWGKICDLLKQKAQL